MATSSKSLGLPLGPNGNIVTGKIETNSDGSAKWYKSGDPYPTLVSTKDENNYQWKFVEESSITNLRTFINTGSGTQVYATNADLTKAFYVDPKSINSLNTARLNTFNSPTGLNSPELAKQLKVPGAVNTGGSSSTSQIGTDDTGTNDSKISISDLDLEIKPTSLNPTFEDLFYPTNIRDNGQDFIKFDVIEYIPRKLDTSKSVIGILDRKPTSEKNIKGSIILPIQPSITDNNNVDWNGMGINPIEMEMVSGSLNIMSGSGQSYVSSLVDRLSSMGANENVIKAVKIYFAQKAAGVEGLLTRLSGAVVNPNLELLFQGPTLRPFTFTFRLSPRDNTEAEKVRRIIRVFKQYSSPGTSSDRLFLTTPNVFNIKYMRGKYENNNQIIEAQEHPSLNKIKTCALKSINVDYTPDGSYMTFNEANATMTSYNLTLQFQELEPVTTKDYIDENIPYDQIGY